MRDAGFDAVDELEDFRGVVGVERAGKSITYGVGYVQRFLEIFSHGLRRARAEDSSWAMVESGATWIENRWRDKIAAIVAAPAQALSASSSLPSFCQHR